METENNQQFTTVSKAARRLGVPCQWLEDEARDGRIPTFKAGRRTLCDIELVREALRQRALERCTGQIGGAA